MIYVADWVCQTCGWSGIGLGIGAAVEVHHKWNKQQFKVCTANLLRVESKLHLLTDPVLDPRQSAQSTQDMVCMREGKGSVEFAMSYVMAWLMRSKYRLLVHNHTGFYMAKDEVSKYCFTADSIVGLYEMMTQENRGLK